VSQHSGQSARPLRSDYPLGVLGAELDGNAGVAPRRRILASNRYLFTRRKNWYVLNQDPGELALPRRRTVLNSRRKEQIDAISRSEESGDRTHFVNR
jgi:hypothetical protein